MMAVIGEATQPSIQSGLYRVGYDGKAVVVPATGGITPNVRVGDSAFGYLADHVEPGVSARHPPSLAGDLRLDARAVPGDALDAQIAVQRRSDKLPRFFASVGAAFAMA